MVFDHEEENYKCLIAALLQDELVAFQDEAVQIDDVRQVRLKVVA